MMIVAVIPIKMGSKRLSNKNLLPFGESSLLVNICEIAKMSQYLDEVYVYSSSEHLKDLLPSGVKFLLRDERFDSDETSMNDILYEFSKLIDSDIYVLLHSTAPFIKIESIDSGIMSVISEGFDSAFAVKELHEFLWNKKNPVNYQLDKTPRTQDLKGYYIETSSFYVYKKEIIRDYHRRIGFNHRMITVSDIESIDIDEKLDYDFALLINEKLKE